MEETILLFHRVKKSCNPISQTAVSKTVIFKFFCHVALSFNSTEDIILMITKCSVVVHHNNFVFDMCLLTLFVNVCGLKGRKVRSYLRNTGQEMCCVCRKREDGAML